MCKEEESLINEFREKVNDLEEELKDLELQRMQGHTFFFFFLCKYTKTTNKTKNKSFIHNITLEYENYSKDRDELMRQNNLFTIRKDFYFF